MVVNSAVSGASATLWRPTRRRGREYNSCNTLRRTSNLNFRRGKLVRWHQEREELGASGGVRIAEDGV